MKTRGNGAFTQPDLLIVLSTLVLCAILLPILARPKRPICAVNCSSNLKQIGLAFRMWANEHGEKFPMELTSAEGGTRESALQGLPLASFMAISNEINNPKPFTCPDDTQRTRATMFPQLTAKNLSYFLGVDAAETNPASILSGDPNLLVNGKPASGFVQITDPATVTWGPKIHKTPGQHRPRRRQRPPSHRPVASKTAHRHRRRHQPLRHPLTCSNVSEPVAALARARLTS